MKFRLFAALGRLMIYIGCDIIEFLAQMQGGKWKDTPALSSRQV